MYESCVSKVAALPAVRARFVVSLTRTLSRVRVTSRVCDVIGRHDRTSSLPVSPPSTPL